MISSRPTLDVMEEAQLALWKAFTEANKASHELGFGGLQRLDIQVVDGQFSVSWVHGPRHQTTDRGQKIENWSDLRFIPKDR